MKSLFAAIILFTRLPLWRIVRVDKKQYAEILLYWPIVGFLTGATTWGTLYLASWVMPLLPACVIAVIARLLLTGALHEDGLADFFDGFGADVLSKLCTAVMINTLPYARTEEESKVKVLYRKIRLCEFVLVALLCLTALWLMATPFLALIPTLLILTGLRWYFNRKIGGYTGDCCGASVLLAEQFFYIGATIVYTYSL